VLNGEAYLRECIESVLAQTYTDWDYTILDNSQFDGSVAIAREYAAKDPGFASMKTIAFWTHWPITTLPSA
jgi:glycosyltransferase involved in cell wall biosynthesis